MSLLQPRRLICATLGMLVLFTSCSPRAPEHTQPNQPAGVLLRSGPGASSLPHVIVPVVDFPDATVAEFVKLFGDMIVGSMQWSEPGMRMRVTCSEAVKHKRFRLEPQEKLTALELLTQFALASQTVVEVNEMTIHIRACDE
ncbi:hypothetical protein [Verrucomicrobium sp. BvORR106]|uniref:hypothetical protein n=1 Tax=Verrucomicrobium sp. BvORR106 TaxID=1403819 RepID=UPI00056FAF32|nr:hypothetical protein [Verrucomicrobium sp. BvORR106]